MENNTINEIFASLDEKIFDAEMKQKLSDIFESEVNEKAELKAIELADAKVEELKESIQVELKEEFDKSIKTMEENITEYLDLSVKEYFAEKAELIKENENSKKADALLEAFSALVATAGKDIKNIIFESEEDNSEVDELKEQVNKLVQTNQSLKKINSELVKTSVIDELTSDLTETQKIAVQKLTDLVEFDIDDYTSSINKFIDIIDTVKGAPIKKIDEQKVDKQEKKVKKLYSQFI